MLYELKQDGPTLTPVLSTANEMRTAMPLCEDMACFTDLPTSPSTGTADHDHLLLVPMAVGKLRVLL